MNDAKVVQHPDAIEEVLLVGGPHHGEWWAVAAGSPTLTFRIYEQPMTFQDHVEDRKVLYARQVLVLPVTKEKVEVFVHATC